MGNVMSIPELSIRMANLYGDDILCNNCFINQLYERVTSPLSPNSEHPDYLVDQLYDIQDMCNVTLPDYTVRLLDWYDTAPPLTSSDLGPSATPTLTAPCDNDVGRNVKESSSATCDSLSLQYGVSTGALQWLSNSDNCDRSSGACLPEACNLRQVTDGETCVSLAASIGDTNSTTLAQFMKWNPYVLGLCDSLTAGQYI
ncbi:hypothetical protein E0Z10_g4228 [Xylaria hypoxylon]|uniref:LysM domain-containing protein n=1 Tax=Xylaria hypoxylon TaxID=37992 RepID=A0A4Z0YX40_9PEZI|nr:hypothetical protein E0Z10_g4228 [Xylaria hypoxylon]